MVFSLEINPYINRIQNYIFLKPVGFETTIRGAFPVWEYQQTNALMTGLDFETHWKVNKNWQHQFSMAYVNGKDISANEALIDMSPLSINNKIQFGKHWGLPTFFRIKELCLAEGSCNEFYSRKCV